MKIFFNFSKEQISKHEKSYKKTAETIKSLGHTFTRDCFAEIKKQNKKSQPVPLVQKEIMSGIIAADLVVLDMTVKSADIGFQLAHALQKEKPVLFLAQDSQEKVGQLFAGETDNPLLTIKGYNDSTLKNIVTDYLANNSGSTRVRFNLVMDKRQDNYIEWAAFTNSKSKTEIIKQAIAEHMKADTDYQRYLLKD